MAHAAQRPAPRQQAAEAPAVAHTLDAAATAGEHRDRTRRRVGLALAAGISVAGLAMAGCSNGSASDSSASSATSTTDGNGTASASVPGTVSCSYPVSGSPAKAVDPPAGNAVPATGTATATMALADGKVTLTLDRSKTPCTVNSFLSLAKQGWFNATKCHRLTTQGIFVLQCGDPTGTGSGGPGYSFADELSGSEKYTKGTVAMANAGANTNGSQFFLVYEDSALPPDYTVFGHMDAAGLADVQKIANAGTSSGNGDGAPAADATIHQVTLG